MPDAHRNFAYSTVATAPDPADSGTSLTVETGHGSRFPAAPFNATVWPAGDQPLVDNAEIVRVTAVAGDVLTITRAQEGTLARSVVVGDQIAATITVKTLTDVEVALRKAVNLTVRNNVATPNSILDVSADEITIENLLIAALSKTANLGITGPGGLDAVPPAPPPPSTDDFNRANNNSLGASWTESENDARALRVLSNQLRIDLFDTTVQLFYRGYAKQTAGNDQYSQLVYKAQTGQSNGAWAGPAVRIGSGAYSSATLYGAFYGGATPKIVVRKFVNQPLDGFGTDLGSYTVTLVSGDIVKIQAVGPSIKVYVNGTERISVTDSSIASGGLGVAGNNQFSANPGANFNFDWDTWEGGNTGITAANQWLAVWLIATQDGTADALLSASFTSPTMPSGYTKKRRVGTVRVNAPGNFYKFQQIGDKVMYNDEEVSDSEHRILNSGSATTFTAVTGASRTAPPTSRRIIVRVALGTGTTATQQVHVRPTGSGFSTGRRIYERVGAADVSFVVVVDIDVDSSQSFDYRLQNASPTVFIVAHGHYDQVL